MKSKGSRATGRVTLAQVAGLAGVSAMTASRALRGETYVKSELVQRVKEAAQSLGYLPDPAARALASRHSHHVAVLVPMLSNNLFVDVLEAIQRTLRPGGFQTLIGITHYDQAEEEQLLREQLLHRPAGILMTGFDQSQAARQLIAQSATPCVHMMELTEQPDVYCVGFSQEQAARALTRHLIELGRKRIAFVAAQLDARTIQRMQGWRIQMQEAGLYSNDLEFCTPQASSMRLGFELMGMIMAKNSAPVDAIFFCNDDLAQGALLCAQQLGVAVPKQVAVAGFNDLIGSEFMQPALTTVRTPRVAIGQGAAQMLLTLMKGQTPAVHAVDVGFELRIRQST